jgi:predicted permease
MLAGWCCARFKLVDQESFSKQLNNFAMVIAIPAFILQFLGIKSDLRDLTAWR